MGLPLDQGQPFSLPSLTLTECPGRREMGAGADFRLTVDAVNPTGWGGLKLWLTTSTAHVILASETWVPADEVTEASQWALDASLMGP